MHKKFLIIIVSLIINVGFSQNLTLAKTFFDDGEYEKALVEYEKLLKKQPHRADYLVSTVKCYQELEKLDQAKNLLSKAINKNRPQLLVELGYNYELQKDSVLAKKNYQKAIEQITENPNSAYSIGRAFEKHSLLKEAKETYLVAMATNPNMNLNFQLASIYGQLNEIELMFNSYLNTLETNKQLQPTIQRYIAQFVNSDAKNENNILLKRALLKKLHSNPNALWNEQLSWLYVQQQEYHKAFVQEKAIFKRAEQPDLTRIFDLALTAKHHHKYTEAKTIFNFIANQPLEKTTALKVQKYLLEIETNQSNTYDSIVVKYNELLNEHGINAQTLDLQLDYCYLLAFKMNLQKKAITFLQEHKKQRLGKFNQARYNMLLADILVAEGKFNQALIYYSKIQRSLKNNVLSQEARYKVAKTSYFKGDFDWALQQVKVLKTSTSQLIANDALDLHLLISDHTGNKDDLPMALNKFAEADLLAFQNKKQEAINKLDLLLTHYKGQPIEDDAYYLQAKLFEKSNNYNKARENYEFIINNLKESIFLDNALYRLGMLNLNHFQDEKKAKQYFETLIFNHADSIHFVDAQKMYRKLRGDSL
ncbi:tetratricopeptide repeat protein [Pseudofulvibacter geojedonensis]|uniref:Tetratricopeptide repeat protein n=1 Tax=Pseudofulvibacter geojedonensis TaxID=1123758 RepID=A0ABW3I3A0_9FLAO